jgi:hypothetical protein
MNVGEVVRCQARNTWRSEEKKGKGKNIKNQKPIEY